jgi:4-amino-4-deoxy-L-arabinose transferase-like glycosyltransferase
VRGLILPLTLLAALTFFVGLGRGALTDADEAFYGESAREMVASGDWITPYYNYEPRFQKPILYYWLTAATYLVTGPSEIGARLWSALSGLGLVLVTAACARRWYDERVGLLAGAIVATNFGYFAMARSALPDLPLALCITMAIWTAFVATLERERQPRRWVLLSALAIACGVLMKGPVGLALPAIVVMPVLLIERRAPTIRRSDLGLAVLLGIVVAAPWYLAMFWRHGPSYLDSFFVGDNFERFATSRFNDPRPWWFYVPVIAGGLLPWTPLATVWLRPVRRFLARRKDIGTLELRLLLWAFLPLAFYTASIGKQPRYILPMLPPIAILLAGSILERTSEWRGFAGARSRPRPDIAVVSGGVISGVLLLTLAALLYRARTLLVHIADGYTVMSVAIIGVAGLAVVIVSLSRAWRTVPAVLALAAAVGLPALHYGALSASGEETVRQMAHAVLEERHDNELVASYQVFVRNLVFYTGVRQGDLINEAQLRTFLSSPARVLAIMRAETADELQRSGVMLKRLREIDYVNSGAIRLRTLIWPEEAEDMQKVVLVSNR